MPGKPLLSGVASMQRTSPLPKQALPLHAAKRPAMCHFDGHSYEDLCKQGVLLFSLLPRQSRVSLRFQPRREELAGSNWANLGPSPPSSCMGTLRCRLPSLVLLLTLLLGACIAAKDYYDLLSVPKGASESQIKRAYRKLALQYHPVSPSPLIDTVWHHFAAF